MDFPSKGRTLLVQFQRIPFERNIFCSNYSKSTALSFLTPEKEYYTYYMRLAVGELPKRFSARF
jgi:hypothetical protein